MTSHTQAPSNTDIDIPSSPLLAPSIANPRTQNLTLPPADAVVPLNATKQKAKQRLSSGSSKSAADSVVQDALESFCSSNPGINSEFMEKYKLTSQLGIGGFGFVCGALRRSDNKSVAVKFIVKQRITAWFIDQNIVSIPLEIHVLTECEFIHHQNIIQFIEYFEDKKYFYLVTELFGSPWGKEGTRAHSRSENSTDSVTSTGAISRLSGKEIAEQAEKPQLPPQSPHLLITRMKAQKREFPPDRCIPEKNQKRVTLVKHKDQHLQKFSDLVRSVSAPNIAFLKRIPSMDLFECIERNDRLQNAMAQHVFRQIAQAVHYLHTHNIAHRDLKDENIVIDEHFKIKLIDFGSAIVEDENAEGVHYHTQFRGTLQFAPPEVLSGFRYRAKPADMWACGVLLYTILSGETPFSSVNQVIAEPFKNPRYECDPNAIDLMNALLAKDPKKRLTSQQVLEHAWLKQN
ncbi:kinase-like domain-containing protein [Obelidium mucronatum]|nr:kinase-like domain-containing protein [Obelidium mucronatum]